MTYDKANTNPGRHPSFELHRFEQDEQSILKKLENEWYLTNCGEKVSVASSTYEYFLMKPTKLYSEMFNIDRELVCVFSRYERFEPRTLDVFDIVQKKLSTKLRTEKICRVLISRDKHTEAIIDSIIKTDPEQPIVIPFSYEELLARYDDYFMRNKFVRHFYSRDLFSFFSPLKKDIYFFGRSQLVQDIINRHKPGEHTGLFGIRKSGKTSIIYALERSLDAQSICTVSIDCENPSVHQLRWNELLHRIIVKFRDCSGVRFEITESGYEPKTASDSFESDFLAIFKKANLQSQVLFIFDEIERVSPRTASSEHWRNESDFVLFWQTLRGFFQRNQNSLTYLLVGTNPSCIEQPMINGHENPIFASIPTQYVPPFQVDQVKEMARKLGRYMGVRFDEILFAKLTEDLGGHPYLIRKMCSDMIKMSGLKRPIEIDRSVYEKCKSDFTSNSTDFLEMIVQVLKEWYPDEFDMLCFLANGDTEEFEKFATDNTSLTKHLVGYGLISRGSSGYVFNIDFLKKYLQYKHKYEKVNLSYEDKLSEISQRRNRIERRLRQVIKTTLRISYGPKYIDKVLSAIPEERRAKIRNPEQLLDRDNSPLFLLDLVNIIDREWAVFANIFSMPKEKAMYILRDINSSARQDAHAKGIEEDTFIQVRLHFKTIESVLSELE